MPFHPRERRPRRGAPHSRRSPEEGGDDAAGGVAGAAVRRRCCDRGRVSTPVMAYLPCATGKRRSWNRQAAGLEPARGGAGTGRGGSCNRQGKNCNLQMAELEIMRFCWKVWRAINLRCPFLLDAVFFCVLEASICFTGTSFFRAARIDQHFFLLEAVFLFAGSVNLNCYCRCSSTCNEASYL